MIVATETPQDVELGKGLKPKVFGGNVAYLQMLLRDSIYSTPKQTAIKEYLSNARDAHREVGKSNVPVKVHFDKFNGELHIIDEGPGMDDDRWEIFSTFGESTKRNSDLQNGGFGIGGKLGFAVTDQFRIVTTYKDADGQHWRREHLMLKNEVDHNAHLDIDKQAVAPCQTGTSIILPILNEDAEAAIEAVQFTCRYWDVRPEIIGEDFVWPTLKFSEASSDRWKMELFPDMEDEEREKFFKPMVIIDGMQYSIDVNKLVMETKGSIVGLPVRLMFKVGEVAVNPNREQLSYRDEDVKAMSERMSEASEEYFGKALVSVGNDTSALDGNGNELFKFDVSYVLNGTKAVYNVAEVEWNGYYSGVEFKLRKQRDFRPAAQGNPQIILLGDTPRSTWRTCAQFAIEELNRQLKENSTQNAEAMMLMSKHERDRAQSLTSRKVYILTAEQIEAAGVRLALPLSRYREQAKRLSYRSGGGTRRSIEEIRCVKNGTECIKKRRLSGGIYTTVAEYKSRSTSIRRDCWNIDLYILRHDQLKVIKAENIKGWIPFEKWRAIRNKRSSAKKKTMVPRWVGFVRCHRLNPRLNCTIELASHDRGLPDDAPKKIKQLVTALERKYPLLRYLVQGSAPRSVLRSHVNTINHKSLKRRRKAASRK